MKVTKFEHACLVVERDNQSLIVDPGEWTTDLVIPDNVVGVVITHAHQDHLDKKHLRAIVDKNPSVTIVGHEAVIAPLGDFNTRAAVANENMSLGNFDLDFFGGEHSFIYTDRHVGANLGVMVNSQLYYPGDSFSQPEGIHVDVLALPISAPWLKFSEVADFVEAIKAKFAFPTHDAILSDVGKQLLDRMAAGVCENVGTEYRRIDDSPLVI